MTGGRRERIAAALGKAHWWSMRWMPERDGVYGLTDALMPVVDRLCVEAAAEALESARAEVMRTYNDEQAQEYDPDYYGGLLTAESMLSDRAAQLREGGVEGAERRSAGLGGSE